MRRLTCTGRRWLIPAASLLTHGAHASSPQSRCAASATSSTADTPSRAASRSAAATSSAGEQSTSNATSAPPPPPLPDGGSVDATTAEQLRISQEIGPAAFEENTKILKQLASRGLRAFAIAAVGVGAFAMAMRRKKAEVARTGLNGAAEGRGGSGAALEAEEEDVTQRYLEEMRGLGFDVDTLEEELELERLAKEAAKKSS